MKGEFNSEAHIWTPLFCKSFLFDFITSGNAVAPNYPTCCRGLYAPGPDGFPRVSLVIILAASKAHALNRVLKTPV
jgi:hypothetical protein